MHDEHPDDWTPPYDDEDFGFQTTNISPKYTGLPFPIFFWHDWRPAQLDSVRIEVEVQRRKFCAVSVEDVPKKLGDSDIPPADFEKISQFILKNRRAIEAAWRGEADSRDLFDALQPCQR